MTTVEAKQRVAPLPGLGTCEQCRWWIRSAAFEVAVMDMAGTSIPREHYEAQRRLAIASGNTASAPKALAFLRIAPCSRHPAWENAPAEHWCGEWWHISAIDALSMIPGI